MWQAESRFDQVFQEKYFAGDFFEFGRSGKIWSRTESILLHLQVIDCVLPLPHFQARLLAPGVVQITYDSIVRLGNETQYAQPFVYLVTRKRRLGDAFPPRNTFYNRKLSWWIAFASCLQKSAKEYADEAI